MPETTNERSSRAGASRVEDAHRRILALITDGSLQEGARLPSESDMATSFGVSRPVIRQALTRLQEAGIVDVRWGAGSYVKSPGAPEPPTALFGPVQSLDELRLNFELRVALEGEAAALAASRATPASLQAIRDALDKLEIAIATNAVGQDADLAFHLAVAIASENYFFERVMRSIRRPVEFGISLGRLLSQTHPAERLKVVQGEHVEIFAAIERGDETEARNTMRRHLQNAAKRIFNGPGSV